MKKIILCLSLLASFAHYCYGQSTSPSAFELKGQITGKDTGTVYLHLFEGKHTDSTALNKGAFSFKDTLSEAQLGWISFSGVLYKAKSIFIEPGHLDFKGDIQDPAAATITGGSLQAPYEYWQQLWNEIHLEAGKYYEALNAGTDNGKKQAPDSIRQYVDAGFLHLSQKTDSSVLVFLRQYPNSPVSAFVVVSRYIDYPNQVMLDSCIKMLGSTAKASYYGRKIQQYYTDYLKTAIGASPTLSLPDSTGKTVSLTQFKGKYLLVDFWASWCAPCRKENPNVVAAYQRYHDKGLEILGVSLDENKKSWLKAVQKDGLDWQHVSDLKGWQSGPVLEFGIHGIPFNFLVDPQGKIVARNLRGDDLAKKLQELLP